MQRFVPFILFSCLLSSHAAAQQAGEAKANQKTTAQTTDANSHASVAEEKPLAAPVEHTPTYPATNPDNYSVDETWQLVWSDEFDGDELDLSNWTRQVMPDPFNGEWQQYFDRKENSYVKDGYLVLKAIHTGEKHGDNQYTSARLHTGTKHSWKYGKIVARIQLPYGRGTWPAFWTLGEDIIEIGGSTPWPHCGEIDILEFYGSRDNSVVDCNLHYDKSGHTQMGVEQFKLEEEIFADKFHVFEIEWDEKQITWSVDGKAYHTESIEDPSMNAFHGNHYILLNVAIGGYAGAADDTTPFPQQMFVDWVRVYQTK